jgi:hypothetical protein
MDYTQVDYIKKEIDFFQKYTNTLAFLFKPVDPDQMFPPQTWSKSLGTTPLVKAMVREAEQYLRARGYREIPIGGGGWMDGWGIDVPEYLMCDDLDIDTVIDFYAVLPDMYDGFDCLNPSGMFPIMMELFKPLRRPLLVAHGCPFEISHKWEELQQIFSPPMIDIFSGVIIHDWFNLPSVDARSDWGRLSPQMTA